MLIALPQLIDSKSPGPGIISVASFSSVAGDMPSRNEELKAMAEECRRLAAAIEDQTVRSRVLAVAQHFDRLADPRRLWDIVAAFRSTGAAC